MGGWTCYDRETIEWDGNIKTKNLFISKKLGVGTPTPGEMLTINDVATSSGRIAAFFRAVDADGENVDIAVGRSLAGGNSALFGYRYDTTAGDEGAYIINFGDNFPTCIFLKKGGNVGIGTISPNANALLDVSSTTKAFMPPRMTTTQRDAIASPTAGMVIYNSSTNVLNFHNGTAWGAV